ncbi:hypothetical protein F0U63_05425 [Cystobacter fuscus]|nr:hypothetical protein F0U63_05425 [Cystobacter fuscus]
MAPWWRALSPGNPRTGTAGRRRGDGNGGRRWAWSGRTWGLSIPVRAHPAARRGSASARGPPPPRLRTPGRG